MGNGDSESNGDGDASRVADAAVAGVEAVVGMVVLAFVDEVTSVATSVAEARLEEGVMAVEANGAASV